MPKVMYRPPRTGASGRWSRPLSLAGHRLGPMEDHKICDLLSDFIARWVPPRVPMTRLVPPALRLPVAIAKSLFATSVPSRRPLRRHAADAHCPAAYHCIALPRHLHFTSSAVMQTGRFDERTFEFSTRFIYSPEVSQCSLPCSKQNYIASA